MGFPAHAQIKTSLTLSERQKQAKQTARSLNKKYRELRKNNKKNINSTTKATRATIDSLLAKYDTKETLNQAIQELEQQELTTTQQYALEYLRNNQEIDKPSNSKIRDFLKKRVELPNAEFSAGKIPQNEITDHAMYTPDSAEYFTGSWADQEIEKWASETEELNTLKQAKPGNFENDIHPMQNARQAGMKHLSMGNVNDPQIMEAVQALDKYKKKYRTIADTREIIKGDAKSQKINSLEGEPFGKRIQWSGQFHIETGRPIMLDFNPNVAYRFTKDFNAGIGGMFRWQINDRKNTPPPPTLPVTGFRIFSEYRIIKSYHGHLEYEHLSSPANGNELAKSIRTARSINAGLAKSFALYKKLKGKVMLLYNIELSGDRFYQSPWVVRVGVGN